MTGPTARAESAEPVHVGREAARARLHTEVASTLSAWSPPDASQARLRDEFLEHLARHPDGMLKAGPPAHLTASCLVLDRTRRWVLLTLHRRARQWFQFGGHLELSDTGLRAAAAREAREESDLSDLEITPSVVHLDRHRLVGNFGSCREHLDVRFAAEVDTAASPRASSESLDVRWWPADALPSGSAADLAPLIRAAQAALGS